MSERARRPGRKRGLSAPEILGAAREIILEQGMAAFSMRSLAQRLGRSAAGLYEYFPDKESILCALAEEANRLLLGYLRAADDRHGPALQLEGICLGYLEFARRHPDIFRLLFQRFPSPRRSLEDAVPRKSPYGAVLEAVWRLAAQWGRVPALPASTKLKAPRFVEEVAFSLWALVHGTAELQLSSLAGFEGLPSDATRRAVRALLAGWEARE